MKLVENIDTASKGKKTDDNVKGGEGNSLNYKYRMHDARIGRFFAVDPLARNYPWNSTYAFSENRVIDGVELEGLEWTAKETITKNEEGTQITILREMTVKLVVIDETIDNMTPEELKSKVIAVETEDGISTKTYFSFIDGLTTGEINKFKIEIGVTKDGKVVADNNFKLTAQHEAGHSAGLNHPWEFSAKEIKDMPSLEQKQTLTEQEQKIIKENLMNSGVNIKKELRNDNIILQEQLEYMFNKIKEESYYDETDMVPTRTTPPKKKENDK